MHLCAQRRRWHNSRKTKTRKIKHSISPIAPITTKTLKNYSEPNKYDFCFLIFSISGTLFHRNWQTIVDNFKCFEKTTSWYDIIQARIRIKKFTNVCHNKDVINFREDNLIHGGSTTRLARKPPKYVLAESNIFPKSKRDQFKTHKIKDQKKKNFIYARNYFLSFSIYIFFVCFDSFFGFDILH